MTGLVVLLAVMPWITLAASNDQCLAPMDAGPCLALMPRWYHNAETHKCEQFLYGGCQGNRNNFKSEKECYDTCRDEDEDASDPCLAPMTTGPCHAFIPRWYHNAATHKCEKFLYGGCQGNHNNFKSEEECADACGDEEHENASDPCLAPKKTGSCHAFLLRWYHNAETHKCERFVYGGCHGNHNNFKSEEECANACPSALQ